MVVVHERFKNFLLLIASHFLVSHCRFLFLLLYILRVIVIFVANAIHSLMCQCILLLKNMLHDPFLLTALVAFLRRVSVAQCGCAHLLTTFVKKQHGQRQACSLVLLVGYLIIPAVCSLKMRSHKSC